MGEQVHKNINHVTGSWLTGKEKKRKEKRKENKRKAKTWNLSSLQTAKLTKNKRPPGDVSVVTAANGAETDRRELSTFLDCGFQRFMVIFHKRWAIDFSLSHFERRNGIFFALRWATFSAFEKKLKQNVGLDISRSSSCSSQLVWKLVMGWLLLHKDHVSWRQKSVHV